MRIIELSSLQEGVVGRERGAYLVEPRQRIHDLSLYLALEASREKGSNREMKVSKLLGIGLAELNEA